MQQLSLQELCVQELAVVSMKAVTGPGVAILTWHIHGGHYLYAAAYDPTFCPSLQWLSQPDLAQ